MFSTYLHDWPSLRGLFRLLNWDPISVLHNALDSSSRCDVNWISNRWVSVVKIFTYTVLVAFNSLSINFEYYSMKLRNFYLVQKLGTSISNLLMVIHHEITWSVSSDVCDRCSYQLSHNGDKFGHSTATEISECHN